MSKRPTHISPTYAITEAGTLLLLAKDRRILILARYTSKNKAPTSVLIFIEIAIIRFPRK